VPDDADKWGECEDRAWASFNQQRAAQAAYQDNRRREIGGQSLMCVDCNEAIPAARLQAVPTATRCIHCAVEVEQR